MTVRYKLGCDLSYEVKTPTVFIFNLEVARLLRHHDLTERLTITPDLPRRTYTVPDVQNRYVSVSAAARPVEGSLSKPMSRSMFSVPIQQRSTRRRLTKSRSTSCLFSCPRGLSLPTGFRHSPAANLAICRKATAA